ncbi:MAG TPA: helix-turn-helix transcriptional regulator [Bacteroidales bacterium]|nr:helix-turn-helix transcriptional regulator [Bacteroidales bacterium]HRZ20499.1 helix-turn-helix transcriptional regulator [Bacteroidales bacterium]
MTRITTFEQLLEKEYGKKGTPEREKFETDAMAFRLGVLLKEARKEANLTQEELAQRTGTKKSYISRIESGKSEIQLSTFYRILKVGLGKNLQISIE